MHRSSDVGATGGGDAVAIIKCLPAHGGRAKANTNETKGVLVVIGNTGPRIAAADATHNGLGINEVKKAMFSSPA